MKNGRESEEIRKGKKEEKEEKKEDKNDRSGTETIIDSRLCQPNHHE